MKKVKKISKNFLIKVPSEEKKTFIFSHGMKNPNI